MPQFPVLATRLRWFAPVLAFAAAGVLRGQDLATAVSADDLSPETMAAVDKLFQPWQFNGELRSEAGYNDNIYLSPQQRIGGAFVRGELEAYLLKLPPPTGTFSGFAYVTGDYTDFVSGSNKTTEQEWFGGSEVRWQPIASLQFSVNGQGFYQDQVLDLSATTVAPLIARLRIRGGHAVERTRWQFWRSFWVQPEAQQQRSHFQQFSEDYVSRGQGLRLGWTNSNHAEISLALTDRRRDYAERTGYTAAGRALASPLLDFIQREGELKGQVQFSWGGEWTITTTANYLANRDNGSGYFNFDQKSVRQEFGWQLGKWGVTLSGSAQRTVFLVQLAGIGISPTPRLMEDYDGDFRIERSLTSHWKVFAEHRWERARSNELLYGYEVNTALAGAGYSF